jgi:AbrB family looped-hinge helix DNA binding protein
MNARTHVSPSGDVAIPKDVRDRLGWGPHTPLELVETSDGIRLRAAGGKKKAFPPKTLADLDVLPPLGPPQPVEAISRLSDEDLRRLLK